MRFKFPTLTFDQKIILFLPLALILIGATLAADYSDLWPREEDLIALPDDERSTTEATTGVFEQGVGCKNTVGELREGCEKMGVVWVA
jgi:hypothetical protein